MTLWQTVAVVLAGLSWSVVLILLAAGIVSEWRDLRWIERANRRSMGRDR